MNPEALGRWLLFSVYWGTLTFMTFTPVSGDSLSGRLHEGSPGDQHLAEESNVGPLPRFLNNTTGEIKQKKWNLARCHLQTSSLTLQSKPQLHLNVYRLSFLPKPSYSSRETSTWGTNLLQTITIVNQIVKRSRYMPGFWPLGPQLAASLALSAGSGLVERWTRLFFSASSC